MKQCSGSSTGLSTQNICMRNFSHLAESLLKFSVGSNFHELVFPSLPSQVKMGEQLRRVLHFRILFKTAGEQSNIIGTEIMYRLN
jgi:hypothetical protein